jgi:hypothetical protein
MRSFSPLRGGLFILECVRFSFLTGFLAVVRYNAEAVFPWQIYAVPNALFLLMALFLMLDSSKYAVYSILYISGKTLCLFSEAMSGVAFLRNIGPMKYNKTEITIHGTIVPIAFIVDLITLIIILISSYKNKKPEPDSAEEPRSVVVQGTAVQNNAPPNDAGGHGGM